MHILLPCSLPANEVKGPINMYLFAEFVQSNYFNPQLPEERGGNYHLCFPRISSEALAVLTLYLPDLPWQQYDVFWKKNEVGIF